jgi:2-polyprenyl-6-methoxyphenol hydroxylase-like FAD-dependent oxidoreductase
MKAIIIGAGIGGLSTAVGLQQQGIEVHIYEQATAPRMTGAGLTLWANALRAYDRLGIELDDLLVPFQGVIRRADGTVLSQIDADAMRDRFGKTAAAIHRTDLMQRLLDNLDAKTSLHYGKSLVRYSHHDDSIRAHFDDKMPVTGDLLIGCDGIHSAVRGQMHPTAQPVYRGYPAWRAIVNFDHENVPWGETWGRGARFGIVPLSDNRIYWFATANRPAQTPPANHRTELERLFADWHYPIPQLIAATPDDALLYNDIADLDPLPTWIDGRAVLLGDAAHAMTPNMGQGACQAIEDAAALAAALSACHSLDDALRAYEDQRLSHTAHIVRQSRRIGRVGQFDQWLLVTLRNRLMQLIPSAIALRGFDSVLQPPSRQH